MRNRKARPIPKVIQEQLELLVQERDKARGESQALGVAIGHLKELLASVEHQANSMGGDIKTMRASMEDLRRQRDMYKAEAENATRRCRAADIDLARAMGNRLIEQRQRVAHRAFGGTRHQ
jgi:chromosome segregation ATPase